MKFFWEMLNQPTRHPVLDYVHRQSNEDIKDNYDESGIPKEFGKQFVIGAIIPSNQFTAAKTNRNQFDAERCHYYYFHFMEDIDEPDMHIQGMKSGILQIHESGYMAIVDNHHNLLKVSSSFIFKNDILEFHSNEWLEHQNGISNEGTFCNII